MEMPLRRFLVSAWLALLASSAGASPLEVETSSGKVRGHTVESLDGRTVDAFLGVPYGAPTDGSNRFSPPKEVAPWDGVLEATKISAPCFQVASKEVKESIPWISTNEESENCLTLNIWVPNPRPKNSAVMVWIYGGGFAVGSTDVPMYNGAGLSGHENVIVVSLNYRLSVFGFLYLDHPLAPGNVGLMDQTQALQWVNKNIKAFGGDPERVTIFGQSAGGASVTYQLLVPASLDLFQNAIVHSGSSICHWAYTGPEYALKHGLLLAERAGCPVQENQRQETVRCLQNLSAEKILELSLTIEDKFLKMVFRPVIDGKYLRSSTDELFSTGKFCKKKNVLIGFTREDGSFVLPVFQPDQTKAGEPTYTENEFKLLISKLTYVYEEIPSLSADMISHVYSEWNPESLNYTMTFNGFLRFLTDQWFGCSSAATADKIADNGNSVYFYRFDHEPHTRESPLPSWMGVTHDDDIPFVFGTLLWDKASSPEEVKLSKQLMRYWTNFAKTGRPNDDYLPEWPKYTSENKQWLLINGKNLTVDRAHRQKECAFLNNILPKMYSLYPNEL